MDFNLPLEQSSIIKVVGIGGGGSNAVNYMFEQGIRGVNFVIGNTDEQALDLSPVPNKIQLGPHSTEGLGAGSNPELGKIATEESIEEIRSILEKNTKMVFITAGMGGGTGTGGAPVVAEIAKEMGILTVGIVTTPFFFEGRRKLKQAQKGIEELRNNVDSLIVISNDKIREIYGNLTRSDAFAEADNILAIAAKSISEIITVAGQVNVDFADVEYVMKSSGVAIMGNAIAEGEDRAAVAITNALSSPLLNDNDIRGAEKILLNITSGTNQVTIDEISEIHEHILEATGTDVDVIFGTCDDDSLDEKISVTVIATGFEEGKTSSFDVNTNTQRIVHPLYGQNKAAAKTAAPVDNSLFAQTSKKEETEEKVTHQLNDEPVADTNPVGEVTEAITDIVNDDEGSTNFTLRVEEGEATDSALPNPDYKRRDLPTNDQAPTDPIMQKRVNKLTDLSYKINNPSSFSELENVPAYKRKNVNLDMTPHSSENNLSRYSLEEEDNKTELRSNGNSFLHDNVD